MRIALDSVTSLKQFALPNTDEHHPITEGLNRTHRQKKEEFGHPCLMA